MNYPGARGRNQTTRCRSSGQQYTNPGKGPALKLGRIRFREREEIGDNPNVLLCIINGEIGHIGEIGQNQKFFIALRYICLTRSSVYLWPIFAATTPQGSPSFTR